MKGKTLSSSLTASEAVALWRKKNPEKLKIQRRMYFERLKKDPIRYAKWLKIKKKSDKKYRENNKEKIKDYLGNYILTEEQKKHRREYNLIWRKNNPNKVKRYDKKAKDNALFGGLREKVIQRDEKKCVRCGITREEHFNKYKRDITVDHINRMGRGVKNKDNRLENMETLCISCHMRKDGRLNSLGKIWV